jgi:DNA-binding transcriptional ArsR family regulator
MPGKSVRVNNPEVAREHVTYGESNGGQSGKPLRKLVLIKLADNANDKGECWPSYQHIADQCECSKSAVRNHIDALEDMGLLKRENRVGVNNGTGINPPDLIAAIACSSCHDEIDRRTRLVDAEYAKECALEGMARTQVIWMKEG